MKRAIFVVSLFILNLSGAQAQGTGESSVTVDSVAAPLIDEKAKKEAEVKAKMDEAAQEEAAGEGVERIQVTGSYIKRIDIEGPSPLVTIDKEVFTQTGNATVEDVLKESSYFEAVYGGKSSGYQGHVRFHGQHAGNTLILLNGMRLPKESGSFYTSVSYIPSSSIERIEILKDGSSALYGSDAMAGVINFITRDDMEGGNFSVQYNVDSELQLGMEQSYVASYGKNFSKGNFLIVGQFRGLDPFNESDLGSYPGGGNGASLSSQDKTTVSYGSKSLDDDVVLAGGSCASGQFCKRNELIDEQYRSQSQDISLLGTGTYEFSETSRIKLLGVFNRKSQLDNGGPFELRFRGQSGEFQGGFKGLSDADDVQVNMFSNELGDYITDRVSNTTSLQSQVEVEVSDSWEVKWQNSYSFQTVEQTTLNGDAFRTGIDQLAKSGQLNFNDASTYNNVNLAEAFPTRANEGNLFNSKLIAAGDVMELGSGYLSMAVGAEFEYETFAFLNDQDLVEGNTLAGTARNFDGYRSVGSFFTEFSATPLDNLEIQVAGRFDNYNDMGSTINPKLAVSYRPHNKVLVRSSYGTGFKPPGLSDMFTPDQISRFDGYDFVREEEYGRVDNTIVRNQGITFETSTHYNFGVVYQPTKAVTLTLDQWNFEGKGTISNFRGEDATRFEAENNGDLSSLSGMGVEVTRENGDPNGVITAIQVPNIFNRAQKNLRGVDFDIKYDQRGALFDNEISYGVNSNMSYIFRREERRFEFSELEVLDNFGTQLSNSIYLGTKNNYFRLMSRTLLDGDRNSVARNPQWDFPVYTEYDFSYARDMEQYGKLTLGVKNLLDTQPPTNMDANEVRFGRTSSLFSPLGMRFFMSYSVDI